MSTPCTHCGAFGGTTANHQPNCIVAMVKARDARDLARLKFVAVGRVIMRGEESIARARTHNMALRIANALNVYVPNRKGF